MTDQGSWTPEHVHLVGSIGLKSAEEVFRTVGSRLGRRIQRMPDGEVGGRRLWISWQYPLLRSSPYLVPDPGGAIHKIARYPLLRLVDGVKPNEIEFGDLGYAREARVSYLDFCAARDLGELSGDVKFQVCLPTPMAVIYAFCHEDSVLEIYDAYEKAMLNEVADICRFIPHSDLCIQWDVCHEMLIWDGQPLDMFSKRGASKADILERMCRIGGAVAGDVELGVHLCYADFRAAHFLQPRDAGKMVEFANELVQTLPHELAFLHMPIPILWNDESYYAPLKDLRLGHATELFLGLVHASDGAVGTKARLELARKFVPEFGIATECGFARARSSSLVREIIDIHAAVAREPAGSAG